MHTVFPATIVVAGVLNGALLTPEVLQASAAAWNGRPLPIAHPSENGEAISANIPDVLERSAGHLFNVQFDEDRLRGEFWIDEQRMEDMGMGTLLADMQQGKVIEVSTGYFCDLVQEPGEHKGKAYQAKHVYLRPDHVALLPEEIGACSIADGCGAPRINSQDDDVSKPTDLLNNIRALLGMKTNCSCEGTTMKSAELNALAIKLNGKGIDLGAPVANFSVAELDKLNDGTRALIGNSLKVMDKAADDEEEAKKLAAQQAAATRPAANAAAPLTAAEVTTMIANGVTAGLNAALPKLQANLAAATDKAQIVGRIMGNSRNAFAEPELQAMSVESLKKYEGSIAEVDYSGAGGGFSANAADDPPLSAGGGMVAMCQKPAGKSN